MTGVQTCALPISPKPQNPKTPERTNETVLKNNIVLICHPHPPPQPLLSLLTLMFRRLYSGDGGLHLATGGGGLHLATGDGGLGAGCLLTSSTLGAGAGIREGCLTGLGASSCGMGAACCF